MQQWPSTLSPNELAVVLTVAVRNMALMTADADFSSTELALTPTQHNFVKVRYLE